MNLQELQVERSRKMVLRILKTDPDKKLLCKISAVLGGDDDPIGRLSLLTKSKHIIKLVRKSHLYGKGSKVKAEFTSNEADCIIRGLEFALRNEKVQLTDKDTNNQYHIALNKAIQKVKNAMVVGEE